jgi:hypothetical protein
MVTPRKKKDFSLLLVRELLMQGVYIGFIILGDYVTSTKSSINRNKIYIAALGGSGKPPPPPLGHPPVAIVPYYLYL